MSSTLKNKFAPVRKFVDNNKIFNRISDAVDVYVKDYKLEAKGALIIGFLSVVVGLLVFLLLRHVNPVAFIFGVVMFAALLLWTFVSVLLIIRNVLPELVRRIRGRP